MLLWKDEMIDLLLSYSDIRSGYKNKSRYELSGMIRNNIDGCQVKDYVRNVLKNRSDWKAVPLQLLDDDLRN